jgi:hypothetical protein
MTTNNSIKVKPFPQDDGSEPTVRNGVPDILPKAARFMADSLFEQKLMVGVLIVKRD